MWMPEFEEDFDIMDSERGDMETAYSDIDNDNAATDSPFIYKMKKPPPQLDDFNDYFVKYKTENDGGYIKQFLHYYEGVLNSKAWRFIMNYQLEPHRRDDLKQIFCQVMLTELEKFCPDDKIVFLQQIKFTVQKAWHEYVRTCCAAAYIETPYEYSTVRKVARLYYEKELTVPYDELKLLIAEELNLPLKTVESIIIHSINARYADNIEDENTPEIPVPEKEEPDYTREEIKEALNVLSPRELRILELHAGVNTKTFEIIDRMCYDDIALHVGYASESTVEKKLKEIRTLLKSKLLSLHNE